MTVLSKAGFDQVSAPALGPTDQAIDLDHLARMTLGDRSLEREVLQLFERQVEILMARLTATDPAVAAGAVHTIKGSAHGIGARGVAQAAAAVELAVRNGADRQAATDALAVAIARARTAIAGLLRAH